MAVLYITEYSELAKDSLGNVVSAGKEPRETVQAVTFSTTTQSAAFSNETRFVRLWSDTACFVEFGVNPTANNANDTPLAASTAEFFGVTPGQKVAVVA